MPRRIVSGSLDWLAAKPMCAATIVAVLQRWELPRSKVASDDHHVMSVSTVKKVKSRCFLGLCSTFIRYKVDGRTNWIFILTPKPTTSPEVVINEALELKRENKKANHKPGSVITQHA